MTAGLPGFVLAAYFATVSFLALFGLHRLHLVALYYRHRRRAADATPLVLDGDCPRVLVQLPIYNERFVVQRLLRAVASLDWPADRLTVQLLDDSNDDTAAIASEEIERLRAAGAPRITHLRRAARDGFKAGALAEGLRHDDAPFVAIFDADFVPSPDFLRRMMGSLIDAPDVGMAQGRWTHINRDASLLTRAQAVLLDGHFVMEHGARFRSGRFFNFNGTAGVWRRAAIEDAGGWQHDTLVEDLDLSYRAQLAGWRFVYRQDVEVPAELPEDARSFKSQQHRWAKGSVQAGRKLLPRIWRAELPWRTRWEATLHMGSNLAYLGMVLLLVLLPMALAVRERSSLLVGLAVDLPIFVFATLNLAVFYALSQKEIGGWRAFFGRLPLIPFVLALGASLTPNNARAVVEALGGHVSPFVRTPKGGEVAAARYRLPLNGQTAVEGLLGLYYAVAFGYAVARGFWLTAPFVGLFALGFTQLAVGSIRRTQRATSARDGARAAAPAPRTQAKATPRATAPAPVRPPSAGDRRAEAGP